MFTYTAARVTTSPTYLSVCPKTPPGAQKPVDDITGYLLWGVIALFGISVVVLIGCIVGGIFFRMPHAAKGAVAGLAGVLVAAIGYLILPGVLDGVLGKGCV